MWCKNCNLETNEAICPVCGLETSEDLPVEIYWCNDCRIPVIHVSTAADKGICPVCHGKTRYLTADLRPVFPEERLLIALLLDKAPDALMQKSVWATGSRYYIDGMSLSISTKTFETADIDMIILSSISRDVLLSWKNSQKRMSGTNISLAFKIKEKRPCKLHASGCMGCTSL